jgi:hypothetical protein
MPPSNDNPTATSSLPVTTCGYVSVRTDRSVRGSSARGSGRGCDAPTESAEDETARGIRSGLVRCPKIGSPEGVCGPLPCAAQAAPQVSNRGTLGAGGAWILPGQPPSLLNGCARPRRSPPHNSPVDFHSRLDHLLSRRTHHAGPRTRYREPAADCRPAARSAPPGSPVGIGARGGCVTPIDLRHILRFGQRDCLRDSVCLRRQPGEIGGPLDREEVLLRGVALPARGHEVRAHGPPAADQRNTMVHSELARR